MASADDISAPPAPPPPVRLNSRAPLWRLIDALAAAGWGDLRDAPQSVRSYLLALARIADARSGIAEVTDAQAAERAGLSVRTIIRARTWLQDAGLVVMVRRGARQGLRGVASLLAVTKRALVALLPAARRAKDARTRRRASRPGGAPNLTGRRPFPSWRRKTAPPPRRTPGPSPVQRQLLADAAAAAAHPPRAATIAAARAAARTAVRR
ncbi:hypothetical protein BCE75_10323 [Isoptericola sp. CG 20/1183]|uniref:Helix-turn-helix domain-containing protein n=1 Tax=Isoptericola halotolerans TaxID=300560 RepID=A0ABX5EFB7_9MICO|nr:MULTISPECIES: hypothetical protein [Isoptericola]MCK0116282.1 hypothetical protein [Isoptericola sp. S6320L]PRZ08098.1 hypothetical protein BCL65_10323 [Isoptericola halotolerans]PRZ08896.1 hypothetical protein BCE75_10323 [Isoptericola sp. CG 20/1183]